ncbi:hypothetical protein [Xanthomonas graminis]|uniref:hypothetical protein n=2 Tax=Xanthomonas graminis TaxID=3390026 RepID=UPI001F22A04D|nr:hypothetical protein [Xanthomonas translucens]UKE65995.1 hypothetical protein KM547_01100 [Xanthomonas translucens pv. phlei]
MRHQRFELGKMRCADIPITDPLRQPDGRHRHNDKIVAIACVTNDGLSQRLACDASERRSIDRPGIDYKSDGLLRDLERILGRP